jgi:hypothetical protein
MVFIYLVFVSLSIFETLNEFLVARLQSGSWDTGI